MASDQEKVQSTIIKQINNFDSDVKAATEKAIKTGTSEVPGVDQVLHNSAISDAQKYAQVSGMIADARMKDIEKAIDSYVSNNKDVRSLETFEGRLDNIKRQYDKDTGTIRSVLNAAGVIISKTVPGGGAGVATIKAVTPSPSTIRLVQHGQGAVHKREEQLGDTP